LPADWSKSSLVSAVLQLVKASLLLASASDPPTFSPGLGHECFLFPEGPIGKAFTLNLNPDLRGLVSGDPELATYVRSTDGLVNAPPLDAAVFTLIEKEFGKKPTASPFREWFVSANSDLSLISRQALVCFRRLLDNDPGADAELIAFSALLEPWAQFSSVSVVAKHFLAQLCLTANWRNFSFGVRTLLEQFMPAVPSLFKVVESNIFSVPIPGTLSCRIWNVIAAGRDADPILQVICRRWAEIHRVAKLVRLFGFLRAFTPRFALRLQVLFIILNCTTFVGTDVVLLQSLECAVGPFREQFADKLPFEATDFPGCTTAYEQLCFAQHEIITFQDSFLDELLPLAPDLPVGRCPFAEFLPEMSLATLSLSSFYFAVIEQGFSLDIAAALGGSKRPFVRLTDTRYEYAGRPTLSTDEQVDFFGLCESDWRSGFLIVTPPPPTGEIPHPSYDKDFGHYYLLFISIVFLIDPEFDGDSIGLRDKPICREYVHQVSRGQMYLGTGPNDCRFLRSVLPASITRLFYERRSTCT
jgi:hypothetical protein